MKTKYAKTNTVPLLSTLAGIIMLFTLCLTNGVLAENNGETRIDMYMSLNMVVKSVAEVEAKILDEPIFTNIKNLNDLRQAFQQDTDYLQYPPRTRFYEAIICSIGAIFGKQEYPRTRIHQQLLDKLGSDTIPIVTRCIVAMHLSPIMLPISGEHLFRNSDNSTKFYPLEKDILDMLEFLQIPLTQSVEGITEFSLEFSPIDMAEKGDIRFVGMKNDNKVSFARINRQQILDDWAKIHDALYALAQQPLKVLPSAPNKMPGTERVKQ